MLDYVTGEDVEKRESDALPCMEKGLMFFFFYRHCVAELVGQSSAGGEW